MDHIVVAALSEPNNGIAALAVLVSCFAILVVLFLALVEDERRRRQLGGPTAVGIILLCGLALISPALGLYVAMGLLMVFCATILHASRRESSISLPKLPHQLRKSHSLKRGILAFALFLTVGAALVVGLLIGGDHESHPTVVAPPGHFHVYGTCANGACTVNVCETPAPCGLENVGRLHEGTAVEIECQTIGKFAHAPNGVKSRIWDRLTLSGYYISDLFVEETRTSRFSEALHRCVKA